MDPELNGPEKGKHGIRGCLGEVDTQMPSLPLLGLGFLLAWELIAFSGSVWLNDTGNSHGLSDLFTWTLVSQGLTLILLAIVSKRAGRMLTRRWVLLCCGILGVAGGVLIVIARPSILGSVIYLYMGCILEGVSSSLLFIRGALMFSAQPPQRSLRTIVLNSLFSIALYYFTTGIPKLGGIIMFCTLPLLSAACFLLHGRPSLSESLVMTCNSKLTRRFASFVVAILILSMSLQLVKGYLFIELPPASSIESYVYALMIFVAVLLVLLTVSLSTVRTAVFGNIYRLVSLVLIVIIIVAPLAHMPVVLAGSLSTTVYLTFNIVVWGMLAYIVYQARSDGIRVFGLGYAAASLGAAGGNIIAVAIINGGIGETAYLIVCLVLAIISIIIALFVFPESAIKELLLPIDEEEDDEKKAILGRWRGACLSLSQRCGLSEREQEVFILLAKDKSAQQISEKLVISPHTVRAHIRSIYAKLDVHSHVELVHMVEKEQESYAPEPADTGRTS